MAMRRPRVKASANLMNRKLKSKELEKSTDTSDDIKPIFENPVGEKPTDLTNTEQTPDFDAENNIEYNNKPEIDSKDKVKDIVIVTTEVKDSIQDTNDYNESDNLLEFLPTNSYNCFKSPAKIQPQRLNTQLNLNNVDDAAPLDFEENIIQLDLQKCGSDSTSLPAKLQSRQRFRPTPIFGQRRNSFVGSSPSPHTGEESPAANDFLAPFGRKERHISTSLNQTMNSMPSSPYQGMQKPSHISRIRTESGCSAYSDTYAPSAKLRKTEEHTQRNFTRRDFAARFTNGVPDKSSLKMFDLIYYNPDTNPMELKSNNCNIKNELLNTDKLSIEKFETNEEKSTMLVPQLKLNAHGELILDDKSLEIETTAEQEARKVLAKSSLIFLDENTGMNGFYRRQKRTREWPPEETVKFYRCLQTIGTDFSLMCQLFPKRTRRDLKLKFKKEERCNGALINKALLYPKIFNIEDLKHQLDSEEKERGESERKWKEIKTREVKNIKKMRVKGNSCASRVLTNAEDIYLNENVIKGKFSKRAPGFNESNRAIINFDINPKNKKENSTNVTLAEFDLQIKSEEIDPKFTLQQIEIKNKSSNQNGSAEETIELNKDTKDFISKGTAKNETMQTLETTGNADSAPCDSYDENSEKNDETVRNRTFFNLDDGTLTLVNNEEEIRENNAVHHHEDTETQELDENDVQQILTELAEGSLVLVSTLDPENPDKEVNEIYMLDKNTGDLREKPLDIPDVIVQCILSAMT